MQKRVNSTQLNEGKNKLLISGSLEEVPLKTIKSSKKIIILVVGSHDVNYCKINSGLLQIICDSRWFSNTVNI